MNYNVEIETGSIYEFGKNITIEGTKFIEILDKFLREVELVDEGFDTQTGKVLKEKLIEVINENKKMVNEKYLSYSEVINTIAKTYDEVNEEIKNSVM